MPNINENLLIILRFMLENNGTSTAGIPRGRIINFSGIDVFEFEETINYALRNGYANWMVGDKNHNDTFYQLSPKGVQYANDEMKGRASINLDAERILKVLVKNIHDNEFLTQSEISDNGAFMEFERYEEACQQLFDFGYIEMVFGDSSAIKPTKLGRQMIHRNFKETTNSQTFQSVGMIVNGSINGGNIQVVANAIESEIKQNISALSQDDLHKEIEQTLEKLLEQVTTSLTLQQKAAYIQLAAEFQKEVTKPQPDAGKLHKFLAALGFLSDVGGAIDFGQKTFEVVVKASPYIMLLGQMIVQLLQTTIR